MDFRNPFKLDSVMSENDIGLKMDPPTFSLLRDFIYERCGIYLPENRKYILEKRLSNRLKELNLDSFHKYYSMLAKSTNNQKELNLLFDTITINETSFFRNIAQVQALEDVVLPELLRRIQKKLSKQIRILSAGCASGEEPYTIAMLIHRKFQSVIPNIRLSITGIDISENALGIARRGEYSDFSFRNIPDEYRQKYFKKEGPYYYLDNSIRKMVQFLNVNIVNDSRMKALGTFDLILCRNVLIYFDKKSRGKAIQTFYEILNPGGYLFIGHSESLHGVSQAFKIVHFRKAIGYKKETNG